MESASQVVAYGIYNCMSSVIPFYIVYCSNLICLCMHVCNSSIEHCSHLKLFENVYDLLSYTCKTLPCYIEFFYLPFLSLAVPPSLTSPSPLLTSTSSALPHLSLTLPYSLTFPSPFPYLPHLSLSLPHFSIFLSLTSPSHTLPHLSFSYPPSPLLLIPSLTSSSHSLPHLFVSISLPPSPLTPCITSPSPSLHHLSSFPCLFVHKFICNSCRVTLKDF